MSSPEPENTLTSADVEHLNTLEAIVQRGLDADLEVGQALAEIDHARLYRGTHQTFEAYLRDRWGISGSRAHALIHPAELAGDPSAHAETPAPPTEAQARVREAVRQISVELPIARGAHATVCCGDSLACLEPDGNTLRSMPVTVDGGTIDIALTLPDGPSTVSRPRPTNTALALGRGIDR